VDYSDTTIILPVKNEPYAKEVLGEVISSLPHSKIIIAYSGNVNDLKKYGSKKPNVIFLKQNGNGKGNACIYAFKSIRTKFVGLIDTDGTYDVKDLRKAINLIRKGGDMIIGRRIASEHGAMPSYIKFGNWVITQTANLIYGMHLKDSQTGLRVIKVSSLKTLNLYEQGFGIESEINIKMHKKGYVTKEIPISYHKRKGGHSNQLKLLDGLKLLAIDFKFMSKDK